MNTANLTRLEHNALAALVTESAGNGHDFGLVECVEWSGSRKALGALITSLQNKGVITSIDTVEVNGGPRRGGERYTQYVLASQFTQE